MLSRRFLVPSLAVAAALTLGSCGVDPTTLDLTRDAVPTTDDRDPSSGEPVTGRVVGVDRDGPSVEIVESEIVTGRAATDAARAAGLIGPHQQWDQDFFVVEGVRRWVEIDPTATVGIYDCTRACEHVAGTIEHVLTGAPYGGSDAIWAFSVEDGRAMSVEERYLP